MSVVIPQLEPSSSTSSSSSSSVSSIPARRIRFAPLPDPRALDDDDDNIIDDEHGLHIDTACVPDSKTCSLSSSSPSSDTADHLPPSKQPTTQQLLSHPPIHHPPSWHKPKSLNLLRPFPFRRSNPDSSSLSLTPTQSIDSPPTPRPSRTEEILTLGTINLFRTSSKASDVQQPKSESSGWGLGLTRWTSSNSSSQQYTKGAPLSRSQSAQSFTPSISSKLKLGSKSKSATASPESKSKPLSKTTPSTVRKGTRMLNGRVYGARKHNPNANPFANVLDQDPEFVEWGYGGMGSVRGGRHAGVTGDDHAVKDQKERTRWERLQSDGTFMAGVEKKGVGGSSVVVDEDDGSGMGWVKRRKEQREREKAEKERAEKEAAAKEKAEMETKPEPVATVPDPPAVISPIPVPEVPSPSLVSPTPTLEHNLTTVTVPTHLSRHHSHRRTASRTASSDAISSSPPASSSTPVHMPTREEVSSESESESESEEGNYQRDREDDDDDDEEEDEETQQRRKTALGAGVEKISRHNN